MHPRAHLYSGFTLLELIVVIAITGILISITIMMINPGKLRQNSRNGQRNVDVNTIINAVYQYAIDNNGQFPSTITSSPLEICKTGASSCAGLADLSALTLNQKYLVSMPIDPSLTSGNTTGYAVSKNNYGRITVSAPRAEGNAVISITR